MAAAQNIANKTVKFWLNEIDLYERTFDKWHRRGDKIYKKYKDIRTPREEAVTRLNILWAIVQTRLPALFARDPKPYVERRFKDKDAVGRVASDILERALAYTIGHCVPFGMILRQAILDAELPGRGTVWVRYVPHFQGGREDHDETQLEGPQITNDADDEVDEETLAYEETLLDYVYWRDFGHTWARTWEEVRAVWRRVYLDKEELRERFTDLSDDDFDQIPMEWQPKNLNDSKIQDHAKKAIVYEIWDKKNHEVIWLVKGFHKELDLIDDPLGLESFFPCPRPLYATLGNDELIPVPNFTMYQDQASEIDELSTRISSIGKALKVAGVRDSSAEGLDRLLAEGIENQLVPVDGWMALKEKGGLAGVMELLPLKEIAEALGYLREQRQMLIDDVYEITGISDIIRGYSDPQTTATAEQIKGQFAVLRLSDAQTEVQRFCRDILRIMAQLIAGYDLGTLKQISGIKLLTMQEKAELQQQMAMAQQPPQPGMPPQPPPQPPNPETLKLLKYPTWEEVAQLLENPALREFRIDVETDSTIKTDEDADKQAILEFITATGTFLQQAAEVAGSEPALVQPIGETFMMALRRFKASRGVEQSWNDAIEQIASRPPQQKPDPEMVKAQAQMQIEQFKVQAQTQLEQKKQEFQMQDNQHQQQLEAQRAQFEAQTKAALEKHKADVDAQTKGQLETLKQQHEAMRAQAEIESKERIAAADNATKIQIEEMRQNHERQIKSLELQHQQALEGQKMEHEKHLAAHESQTKERIAAHDGAVKEKLADKHPQAEAAKAEGKKADSIKELGEKLEKITERMTKPRKVKRDKDGRVEALE